MGHSFLSVVDEGPTGPHSATKSPRRQPTASPSRTGVFVGAEGRARAPSAGDVAGGSAQSISLAGGGPLETFCCSVPGLLLFGVALLLVIAACLWQSAFYSITAILSVVTLSFSANLSVSCVVGAWRMRRMCSVNWTQRLERLMADLPRSETHTTHLVILPNYKENEDMLLETLENLGRFPMARKCMRVVLAMEEREGQEARAKADRLISSASHLFADVIAAFHPSNLPGELAGKSSNTQWAFRVALREFAPVFQHYDPSKVFITVGDADTLWHPEFFSALACQALEMPAEERAWSMWQPPILLLRNLFSVPALTRVSCYGTILFELAGVTNQLFGSHFTYSAYSLTLALASHRFVRGWDTDVIAEDHHMFCKCYCAALWDSVEAAHATHGKDEPARAILPKVQLRPVYLPAISYLVESSDGWRASLFARFQQARRHSQGVAELSYIILQHLRLTLATGIFGLPLRTHAALMAITWKMTMVHIVNALHCLAMIMSVMVLAFGAARYLLAGGFQNLLFGEFHAVSSASLGATARWALLAIFGPVPPIGLLMSATTFVVIKDMLEGRLTYADRPASEIPQREGDLVPVAPAVQGSTLAPAGSSTGKLGWLGGLRLYLSIQSDYFQYAEPTILAFGLTPVALAAWSLLRQGTKFDYIVAAKPK